jgi:hypothetical protein
LTGGDLFHGRKFNLKSEARNLKLPDGGNPAIRFSAPSISAKDFPICGEN